MLIRWIFGEIRNAIDNNKKTVDLGIAGTYIPIDIYEFSSELMNRVFGYQTSRTGWKQDWQSKNVWFALKAVAKILDFQNGEKCPFSATDEGFNFPYQTIEEVLWDLGYAEEKDQEGNLDGEHWLYKEFKDHLTQREIIWVMLHFVSRNSINTREDWSLYCKYLVKAKKEAKKLGLPDELFAHAVTYTKRGTDFEIFLLSNLKKYMKMYQVLYQVNFPTGSGSVFPVHTGEIIEQVKLHFEAEVKSRMAGDRENYEKYVKLLRNFMKIYVLPHYAEQEYADVLAAQKSGDLPMVVDSANSAIEGLKREVQTFVDEIKGLDANYFEEKFIPDDIEEIVSIFLETYSRKDLGKALDYLADGFYNLKASLEARSEWKVGECTVGLQRLLYPKKEIVDYYDLDEAVEKLEEYIPVINEIAPGFFDKHGLPNSFESYREVLGKYGVEMGAKMVKCHVFVRALMWDLQRIEERVAAGEDRAKVEEYEKKFMEHSVVELRKILGTEEKEVLSAPEVKEITPKKEEKPTGVKDLLKKLGKKKKK